MTAKEIADKHKINTKQEGISNFGITNMYIFTPKEFHDFLEQYSKEQRENCKFAYLNGGDIDVKNILNAKQPEV